MKKCDKIICWVTKTHKKLMKKAFPKENISFVDSIDEINQSENDVVVISMSKITSMKIAEKSKKLKDPYFLEKKGWFLNEMAEALESSKHHFMRGNCDINYNLFNT